MGEKRVVEAGGEKEEAVVWPEQSDRKTVCHSEKRSRQLLLPPSQWQAVARTSAPWKALSPSCMPCPWQLLTRDGARRRNRGLDVDQDRGLQGPGAKHHAAHILA